MTGKLKPCPFCGCKTPDAYLYAGGRVHCYRCGADGPVIPYAPDDKFPKWNDRPGDDALRNELKGILDRLTAVAERNRALENELADSNLLLIRIADGDSYGGLETQIAANHKVLRSSKGGAA